MAFILYPGKLTQVETFRVGCIGAITLVEIEQAVRSGIGAQEAGISVRRFANELRQKRITPVRRTSTAVGNPPGLAPTR